MFLLIDTETDKKIILGEKHSVGTFSDCDTKISFLSDVSFFIKKENEKYLLNKKCGSIFINSIPVMNKYLEDGDRIKIGNKVFLFTSDLQNSEISDDGNALHEYLFIDDGNSKENEIFINNLIEISRFAQQVSSILDFVTLLNVVIDLAMKILKTQKGFIILYEEDSKEVSLKEEINLELEIENLEQFNKLILNRIKELLETSPSVTLNTLSIKEFRSIKSIIASRLKARDKVIGYICLLNKESADDSFNDRDKYLIESLASHAAIAIDNSMLYEKVQSESNLRNYLQRYLPRNIVSKLLSSNVNLTMGGNLQECSILFADICNFTEMSSSLSPKAIVSLLNDYLTIMTKVIFTYNGSVDKFIGDGIMAVFGAPISTPNHSLEATLASLEMLRQVSQLKKKFFKDYGITNFNIRIGINTGPVVYGNVGSPQRMDFTVIGDSVNIAARMESNAPNGGILISENTYEKIKSVIKAKEWEPIMVKGKSEPMKVYEVLDKNDETGSNANDNNYMRMHVRVPIKTFVSISKNNSMSHGLIRDISIGGVSVSTVGNYKSGDVINMTFRIGTKYTFRNIPGIVRRIEKIQHSTVKTSNLKHNVIMGIEFKDMTKEKSLELVNYIKKKQVTK